MEIRAVVEYNSDGYMIYAENFVGVFSRGRTKDEALSKLGAEVCRYLKWRYGSCDVEQSDSDVCIVQEKLSDLQICDGDTDVIFDSETEPLTQKEYSELKALALKSAADFKALYDSIPDKYGTVLKPRNTFYGAVPITANEMYMHTKNVNDYYFGEIGVKVSNEPDILTCRADGFKALEATPDYLKNSVYTSSSEYSGVGESWSLRKMCRRFVWHDRIHAKAMYKMAVKLCGEDTVANLFYF